MIVKIFMLKFQRKNPFLSPLSPKSGLKKIMSVFKSSLCWGDASSKNIALISSKLPKNPFGSESITKSLFLCKFYTWIYKDYCFNRIWVLCFFFVQNPTSMTSRFYWDSSKWVYLLRDHNESCTLLAERYNTEQLFSGYIKNVPTRCYNQNDFFNGV